MPLVDNIHKGFLKFNEEDFILLTFNFRGDVFVNEKLIKSDVEVIGNYSITGYLEIIVNMDINISFITNDGCFVIYKIVGNDNSVNYLAEEVIFNTKQAWFNNGKSGIHYKGFIKSELIIQSCEQKNIEKVICDCLAGSIPSMNGGLNVCGRTIYFNKNRNFWNNSKFVKNVFRNILECTFQYKPINTVNYKDEQDFHDKLELILYFITSHSFGVSISKYINGNDILTYIIKDKFSNFSADYFILDNDMNKIKELVEKQVL